MNTSELDFQGSKIQVELDQWNDRDAVIEERMQMARRAEKDNPYRIRRPAEKVIDRADTWYAPGGREEGFTDKVAAEKKVRRLFQARVSKDPAGYTWSMGYNNLVGNYRTGSRPRFSGSSFNRTKQLVIEYAKDLQAVTADLVKVAAAWFDKSIGRWGRIPWEVCALIYREDLTLRGQFELWLSGEVSGDVVGMGVGIHMLSARSRGKIKDKATAFFRASAGDRIFCTLTFVAPVDDRTGVGILNKWLTQVRKRHPKLQYFWVAERQENGNIHFHMILNRRLKIGPYNALWVLAQYNAGLTGKDKYDREISKQQIDEAYAQDCIAWAKGKNKKIMQGLLNPMDVKKVRSITGLSSYLTKYITKQEKNVPFSCAVWHCSRGVSRVFTRTTVGPSAFRYMRSFANYKVDKKTGECWPPRTDQGAFWLVVYAGNKAAPLPKLREMERINRWILDGHVLDKLPSVDDEGYIKHYICE